ncbi:hypothetical protein C8F01DRAFT_1165860, partial [Mycena amicta]
RSAPRLPSSPCMTTPEPPAENDRRANDQQTTSEDDQRGYHRACRCRTDACGSDTPGHFPHSAVATHHPFAYPLATKAGPICEERTTCSSGWGSSQHSSRTSHPRLPTTIAALRASVPHSRLPPLDDNRHACRRHSTSAVCPSPSKAGPQPYRHTYTQPSATRRPRCRENNGCASARRGV